ncbi:rhamnosyltransferase WsaF family glycosyltransferase [Pseudorhodoferax sp.]|uniref:rhamnosyltransferase WsaF family glycosyltransferase n=1 Tax=Pseudorhodoferax sp. TaxID=1993553 RepID=UPI002DD6879A|nr:hypothetical protein [Pseudorhodoferax sp.]
MTADDLRAQRFPLLAPLRFFHAPAQGRRRVTLVTDSISKGSLFGGVGTALLLAVQLANRLAADLRVITRLEPPLGSHLDHLLQVYGHRLDGESRFRFSPLDDVRIEHDLLEDEWFITTSWWTTAATLAAIAPQRIAYLLQEDERMFYPQGDERLRCENLLQRQDLQFIINTELLRQHFIQDGFAHFAHRAQSFEPAFPHRVFRPRPAVARARRRFVFYARPGNARNLFHLGVDVIDAALNRNILNPQQWEIIFVGHDIPDLTLAGDVRPTRLMGLDWGSYAELLGSCDLGLSLMYTPHPSYPPLDMVASGAVAVSTRHGLKQDLSALSRNLILCQPDIPALLAGLQAAVELVADTPRREAQYQQTALARDWPTALHAVVEQLATRP